MGVGADERKKRAERHKSASGEWGEQLRWPLSCPFHLFGNIISTNQGRAKGKWPGLDLHLFPSAAEPRQKRKKTSEKDWEK